MINYYKILGLNKDASNDEIKMAYKRLAMKYHPDRNPNNPSAEEKFKDIKNAYEILTKKHKDNDNIYTDFDFSFNDSDFGFDNFNNSESSLDDIFNVIFQKNFKKDFKINFFLNVSLEQVLYGSIIPIKLNINSDCYKCAGKGVRSSSNIKICSKCSGSGMYNTTQGIFTFKQKCHKCDGKGYLSLINCVTCNGKGKLNKFYNYIFNLPKTTINNSIFKIILNDDLNNIYINIKINPHQIFAIKDLKFNDLYTKIVIDFIKSISGGYIRIHTIYGYILYKIKKSIQSGDSYKLKNLGVNLNKLKKLGDLYVEFYIEIPIILNFFQKKLIKNLEISLIKLNNFKILNNWNIIISNFYKKIF